MLLTYQDAKDSQELAQVSGACSNGETFRTYLNQATRKLMRRGNFFGTVQKIRVCVYDSCIVWPAWVGTVLASDVCGRSAQGANYWFDFLPIGGENWKAIFASMRSGRCHGPLRMENAGTSPVWRNIPCGKQFYIRAYPSVKQDVGKTMTIFGIDNNGQPLRELVNGTWQDGITLTLALTYTTTATTLQSIERIVRQKTQGIVNVFMYDPINNVQTQIAAYGPQETSPNYMLSRLHGLRPITVTNRASSIEALVKLEFVPVVNDTDRVLIENLDALQLMMFSEKYRVAGDVAKSTANEVDAIRELNYGLRDKFPIEQFECSFNPFGTARLDKVVGGFI